MRLKIKEESTRKRKTTECWRYIIRVRGVKFYSVCRENSKAVKFVSGSERSSHETAPKQCSALSSTKNTQHTLRSGETMRFYLVYWHRQGHDGNSSRRVTGTSGSIMKSGLTRHHKVRSDQTHREAALLVYRLHGLWRSIRNGAKVRRS